MIPTKLFVLLVTLIAFKATYVIGFESVVVDDTAGTPDNRFAQEIGEYYTGITLIEASEFVWRTFEQQEGGRKNYASINATIESFGAVGLGGQPLQVARNTDNLILLNADYVQAYVGDVKAEFTGILYHESARVWQWTAEGDAPIGLITGIADYIRLTSGWPSEGWGPRRSGWRWDQGYAVTAYFLEYCNELKSGFVADLNAMMRFYYSDYYFMQLLGKSVHQLWDEYILGYGGNPPAPVPPAPALAPAPAQAPAPAPASGSEW